MSAHSPQSSSPLQIAPHQTQQQLAEAFGGLQSGFGAAASIRADRSVIG